jgi:protein-export membrane protein SecD
LRRPVVTLPASGQSDIVVSRRRRRDRVQLSEEERRATDDRTMQQSLEIIRRRVDEVGTREPTIQRQGADRILIQVPGIGSAAELKALIGTTARLTFHPVVGGPPIDEASIPRRNVATPRSTSGRLLHPRADARRLGRAADDAQPTFDQNGRPAVNFRFNPQGARGASATTRAANIGNPFAIVLDDEVISAPVIQATSRAGRASSPGNFTVEESTNSPSCCGRARCRPS